MIVLRAVPQGGGSLCCRCGALARRRWCWWATPASWAPLTLALLGDRALRAACAVHRKVVLVGDMNVALEPRDAHPARKWETLYAPEELKVRGPSHGPLERDLTLLAIWAAASWAGSSYHAASFPVRSCCTR